MKSARYCAADALIKLRKNGAYSNILLDAILKESGLSAVDKAFTARLFYGVSERELTLEYLVEVYSERKCKRLDTEVLVALEIGLYQLLYMPSVPESAAVNESVALVKQFKKSSAAGMVNAVLRKFIRSGKEITLPKDKYEAMSIKYSCPVWLVRKWIEEYGDDALSILEYSVSRPPVTIRVNTVKITAENLLRRLISSGYSCEYGRVRDSIVLNSAGSIEDMAEYREGLFHVQDISSQLCCHALGVRAGDTILDICAAPGGKSFTLAELSGDKGRILAFDLHENRVRLIHDGAERLGLSSVHASVGDGKEFNPDMPMADKILCDVPCSGLGVISRKPEIKKKSPGDLKNLPQIQYAILENAARYLKRGGDLIYSTCSLSREENDAVVDKFLSEHDEFEGVPFLEREPFGDYKATILPEHFGSDGFFISKIRRKDT